MTTSGNTLSTMSSRAHMGMTARDTGGRPEGMAGRGADSGGARRHSQGAMAYLKNLADELDARGLVTQVIRARSGVAVVWVVNPRATAIHERVTCAPSPAGL